jgi:hypothetical protein
MLVTNYSLLPSLLPDCSDNRFHGSRTSFGAELSYGQTMKGYLGSGVGGLVWPTMTYDLVLQQLLHDPKSYQFMWRFKVDRPLSITRQRFCG